MNAFSNVIVNTLGTASKLITDLIDLIDRENPNKEIILGVLDRISITESIIKHLESNEEIAQIYNKDLKKLINILDKIRNFIRTISQKKNVPKATEISEHLSKLTKEYDDCIMALNFSITIDNRKYMKEIAQSIHEIEEVRKSNLINKDLSEDNFSNQLNDPLKPITSLSKQSEQIDEILTENEQSITDQESKFPFVSKEEKIQLEKQIVELKNQIVNLQTLLNRKEEELVNLRKKNHVLVEQCLYYLTLIKSFREKQKIINKLREEATKKIPSNEEIDNLLYLGGEFKQLEIELEKIINELPLIRNKLLKKRYFNINQLQVNETTIVNSDKVIAELKGHDFFEDDDLSYLNEELQTIIDNSNKNAVKNALLIIRARNNHSNLSNSHRTVLKLQECYENYKSSIDTGPFSIFTGAKDIVTSIGDAVPVAGSGIKAVGGVGGGVVNLFKNNSLKTCRDNFQKYLSNDEKKLFWLRDFYQSLTDVLYNEELPLSSTVINILKLEKYKKESSFNDKYNIRRIVSEITFQNENTLELREMKQTLISLNSNLAKLKAELEEERNKIYELIQTLTT
ncbi:10147_t:CDS:2 [Dentiscutata heterogama]|uniref:10147_t:CDS:1 n=1 Tax=Dentiscutata heterogama TaxID=1316150 RepID=A0ACA9K1H6_9GLOM|nr:10147_t:CDS:2 [Dentiscutata heterogama]